jgi:indolepyruvate ferredoxin oxidoreductase beta subunit
MVNRLRLVPPVVSLGLFAYPDDPLAVIAAQGVSLRAFDAGAIARQLGDLRLVNSIMLGAISEALPFAPEVLKAHIVSRFAARKPALAEQNAAAFDLGRAAAQEAA